MKLPVHQGPVPTLSVFDKDGELVCVCTTVDDAREIVEALNLRDQLGELVMQLRLGVEKASELISDVQDEVREALGGGG